MRFTQVDVFTDTLTLGNPVAVSVRTGRAVRPTSRSGRSIRVSARRRTR